MLVEEFEHVVNDRVLGLGEEAGLKEGGFRNAGAWILAAKLGEVCRRGRASYRGPSVPALPQWRRSPTSGVDGIQGIVRPILIDRIEDLVVALVWRVEAEFG